uniref:Uncharacterized protein n=1 Tax=Panagrolaimus sp. JU765 TaxID=591449 RepID=A0AC34RLL4_9BILA
MVHVSRATRIMRYLQHAPRHLFNKYPEQVTLYLTFGLVGVAAIIYKLNKYGINGVPPYYRGRYEVVRPDDPRALNWRVPTDYPAPYLTNRENVEYNTVAKDYGWTLKL